MGDITYSQICQILGVDRNNPNPRYNPKSAKTLFEHIEQINAIIHNKKEAEEIVNLAQVGELSIVRMMYP